jgi:hypothetical protein
MAILDPYTGRPITASSTPLTDAQRAQLLAAELARKPAPMIVAIDPLTAYTTAKLLQIAIAHPELTPTYAEPGRAVVDLLREYFADAPTILEQLADAPDPDLGEGFVVEAVDEGLTAGTDDGRGISDADTEAAFADALAHTLEIFAFSVGLPASRVARVVERALAACGFTAAILPPGHDA